MGRRLTTPRSEPRGSEFTTPVDQERPPITSVRSAPAELLRPHTPTMSGVLGRHDSEDAPSIFLSAPEDGRLVEEDSPTVQRVHRASQTPRPNSELSEGDGVYALIYSSDEDDQQDDGSDVASAPDPTSAADPVPGNSEDDDSVASDSNLLDRFKPGEASEWSSTFIRQRVLDRFFERMKHEKEHDKDKRGWVYAVRVQGQDVMVKIGFTTANHRTGRGLLERLEEIERDHGHILEKGTAVCCPQIRLAQLRWLERMVFAELAFFQHTLSGRYQEYYAVPLEVAHRTTTSWYRRMEDLGLGPGIIPSLYIRHAITHNRALLSATSNAPEIETDIFKRTNLDHALRQQIWAEVFRDELGGFKATGQRPHAFMLRFGGIVMLLLIALHHHYPHSTLFLMQTWMFYAWDWNLLYSKWIATEGSLDLFGRLRALLLATCSLED